VSLIFRKLVNGIEAAWDLYNMTVKMENGFNKTDTKNLILIILILVSIGNRMGPSKIKD
jgi:prolipoprotein diacylglyceryltransferase